MKTSETTTPREDRVAAASSKPGTCATTPVNYTPEALYDLIAQQTFFKGLSPHQLQLLANSAMIMQFKKGQSIFETGGPANRFYIILGGKVLLESEVKDRGMVPIQTLGPGDDLGWSWLFPPFYLHLSARTLEPTQAIFFYGTRLREQCEQDHDLGYELMKRVGEVAVRRFQATQQKLAESTETATASSI